MMRFKLDPKAREASFSVPSKTYSEEALRIAAAVFDSRCETLAGKGRAGWDLTLRARRKDLGAEGLEALAGEFLNELLNQEYRFLVARSNRKIADLIVAQALLSARGGENPPAPPEGEKDPAFLAEAAKLVAEAEEEIRRTMPRRIPPQGAPIPPEAHG